MEYLVVGNEIVVMAVDMKSNMIREMVLFLGSNMGIR